MHQLIALTKKVVYLGWALILFSCCLRLGAERRFQRYVNEEPYDAIIVPGVPFKNGTWSEVMKMRVHWGVYLYQKGLAKNIIFSGSAVYSPYIEARIMALYAQALGVDKTHILTEERAEHSSENLYYSYRLAKDHGLEKVALATDPFQGFFLRGFAKKINLHDMGFLPVVFQKLEKIDLITPKIDPTWAKVVNFVSIVNRESLSVRFQGTMGKFINFAPEDDPNLNRKKE
ncbi:MAG: YdcF family protein [Aureispira sp.]